MHAILAPEFAEELREEGHIYMRRFRPTEYEMKAYPVEWYPAQMEHARCIIHMVHNNLDPRVAQFPEELITYGGNGSVLSNWAQYHLLMKYLCSLTPQVSVITSHSLVLPHSSFPSACALPFRLHDLHNIIPSLDIFSFTYPLYHSITWFIYPSLSIANISDVQRSPTWSISFILYLSSPCYHERDGDS